MRHIGIFKDYWHKQSEYEKRGLPVPDSVEHLFQTKMTIVDMIDILDWAAQNQAVTKNCQQLFDRIDSECVYSDIPETVGEHFRKCIREVSRLRDDLYGNKAKTPMEKLTIVDEYRGHCEYVYIFPVRNIDANSWRWTYEKNWDNIVGIPHYHVDGFLLESLNNHIDPAIQFFGNPLGTYPDYFEEFGWNFYTKESVENVISDLKLYFHDAEKQNKRYLQLVECKNKRAMNRALNPIICDPAEQLKAEIFFYRRLIPRLNAILKSAVDYEYILFKGP